ncbi:hypothetical protein ACIRBX_22770 [Kitasatospora sp. NPDC096147]|uniref:DUF7489 domain-containing protein n=1 Tax=Kitasatospora sp. NPDC096147 TaxID=3364093 RepID=UPI003801E797
MELILFAIGIVTFVSLLVMASNNRAREIDRAFDGEVVGRTVQEVTLTTGMRTDHTLEVRTDRGDTEFLRVPAEVYVQFEVGDRISKRLGARWPVRASE